MFSQIKLFLKKLIFPDITNMSEKVVFIKLVGTSLGDASNRIYDGIDFSLVKDLLHKLSEE